jgi:hypothetical protein
MKRRHIGAAQRQQAQIKAEQLIAELYTEQEIRALLQKRFGLGPAAARIVCRDALAAMVEEDQTQRAERMAVALRALGRLYRRAWEKDRLQTCLGVIREIKRMQGLDAPLRSVAPLTPDELESRTEEELQYYLANGYWPLEAPKKAEQPAKATDPLERLH